MTWLTEDPMYLVLMGVIGAATFWYGWATLRKKPLLYAAIGTLVAVLAIMVVERLITTDREAVEKALREIAEAVENNDLEAALSHLVSDAHGVRSQARGEFPQYKFKRVAIKSNLKIQLDESLEKATASFNVVVTGSEERYGAFHVPRFVEVTLKKEDDQWKIASYQHYDPQEGMKQPR